MNLVREKIELFLRNPVKSVARYQLYGDLFPAMRFVEKKVRATLGNRMYMDVIEYHGENGSLVKKLINEQNKPKMAHDILAYSKRPEYRAILPLITGGIDFKDTVIDKSEGPETEKSYSSRLRQDATKQGTDPQKIKEDAGKMYHNLVETLTSFEKNNASALMSSHETGARMLGLFHHMKNDITSVEYYFQPKKVPHYHAD